VSRLPTVDGNGWSYAKADLLEQRKKEGEADQPRVTGKPSTANSANLKGESSSKITFQGNLH